MKVIQNYKLLKLFVISVFQKFYKNSKKEQKKHIIDIMHFDEEIGLYEDLK